MTTLPKKYFLLLVFVLQLAGWASAQTDAKLAETATDLNEIKSHISFLASDELRGRDTPSPELNIAARYLSTHLLRYGVKALPGNVLPGNALPGNVLPGNVLPGKDSYWQAVPMKSVQPPTEGSLSIGGETYAVPKQVLMLDGADGTSAGEVVFLSYGSAEDFAKADIRDKVVVVQAGSKGNPDPRAMLTASQTKRKLATDGGAAALVELYRSPQMPWNFMQYYLNQKQVVLNPQGEPEGSEVGPSLQHMLLDDTNGKVLAKMEKDTGKAEITISGSKIDYFSTYNIVGMVEGTSPELKDEFVIYSGHYDHIGVGASNTDGDSIFNGSRDNAVGVVTVLAAAKSIAKNPTKRSALFILFTGEEKGLLGSQWYSENPLVPHKQVVYCFNSDNGGYNDTSLATIIGLERTTAAEQIKQACAHFGLTATDDPVPEQGLFDRSDNVNFAKVGIPAPTFSMGLTAFDEEINKYYHQQADNPETLDYEYLVKFFRSYVYAARLIGNMPERPFWVEGDKYYEAGAKLYGK